MEAGPAKACNQDNAAGFIRLNGLRLSVNSTVNGVKNEMSSLASLSFVLNGQRLSAINGDS